MRTDQRGKYLERHWPKIKKDLLNGTHKPLPVKRKEIPIKDRVRNLEKPGIAHRDAMLCGNARKKYWPMNKVKWVAIAMPEKYFIEKGLYLPGN